MVRFNRFLVFLFILFLLVFFVFAIDDVDKSQMIKGLDDGVSSSPKPLMEALFNSSVVGQRAYFYYLDDDMNSMVNGVILGTVADTSNSNVDEFGVDTIYRIKFKPEDYLQEGNYRLMLLVYDSYPQTYLYDFLVKTSGLDIKFTSPGPYGIASSVPFNYTFNIPSGTCFYRPLKIGAPNNFDFFKDVSDRTEYSFFNVDTNFSGAFSIPMGDFVKSFYMTCKEYDNKNTDYPGREYKNVPMQIGVDTVPPFFDLSLSDNPVKDLENPFSIINFKTSNDLAVCYYNLTYVFGNNSLCGINKSYIYFDGEGEFGVIPYSNFSESHNTVLNFSCFSDNLDFDKSVFSLDVECIDPAGHSVVHSKDVVVQMSKVYDIVQTSDVYWNVDSGIDLDFMTTVSVASCSVFDDDENSSLLVNFGDVESPVFNFSRFNYTLDGLSEGSHSYDVKCIGHSEQSDKLKVVVDLTSPVNFSILNNPYTCGLDSFNINFDASDDVGIAYYNYSIKSSSGDVLKDWSVISGGSEFVSGIDLVIGDSYIIDGQVCDLAGNCVSSSSSIIASNDSRVECDFSSPSVDINVSLDPTGGFAVIDVNCTDSGSGCTDSYLYSYVNTSSDCFFNESTYMSKMYGESLTSYVTQKLCVRSYDVNNNFVDASKLVSVAGSASCMNGVLDDGETDLDCGGSCLSKCMDGLNCSSDVDCLSNFCDPLTKKCSAGFCDDGFLNQDEVNVDCGGIACGKTLNIGCEVGQKCLLNNYVESDRWFFDCNSGYCNVVDNASVGNCALGTCDDGIMNYHDGVGEGDIDCGGPCDVKCSLGMLCRPGHDDDCDSGLVCSFDAVDNKYVCSENDVFDDDTDDDYDYDYDDVQDDGISILGLSLLIFGFLVLVGGSGFLYWWRYSGKHEEMFGSSDYGVNVSMPVNRGPTPEELRARAELLRRQRELAAKRRAERHGNRGVSFDAFDTDSEQKPSVVESVVDESNESSVDNSSKFNKSRKLDDGYLDEYISVNKLKGKEHEDDIFAALDEVSKSKPSSERHISNPKSSVNRILRKGVKSRSGGDSFDLLDNLGDESVKNSNAEDALSELDFESDTKSKSKKKSEEDVFSDLDNV